MKKERPYIIYVKKNKEQERKYLNKFNIYKIYQIINKNRGYDPENNFELSDDIEKIYFCNIEFPSNYSQEIKLGEGQTAIFKNCTFYGQKIEFIGGEIIIIDPNLKNFFPAISTYGVENVYLKLLKEEKDQEIKCYFYRGRNIELVANRNVKELEIIDYSKAKLSKLDYLEYLNLDAEKASIDKRTHLVVSNLATLQTNELTLGEDFLLYANGIQLKNIQQIIGTKFKFISTEDIKIGETSYYNNGRETITISNEDLNPQSLTEARRNLCSQLKGMKTYLKTLTAEELEEQTKMLKKKLLQSKISDNFKEKKCNATLSKKKKPTS